MTYKQPTFADTVMAYLQYATKINMFKPAFTSTLLPALSSIWPRNHKMQNRPHLQWGSCSEDAWHHPAFLPGSSHAAGRSLP